ncbi:MAG: hypothetical protein NXY57DRAFT_190799 [Lentinula lateritia]|uniref:Uncharacterized protein n=1 Tax=Lentinula lateritia TaxID=40482 RepID=A0ABQ8VU82_9AGAR|nr:MAG: hypothetical protein NXY57DRAFT_190799 [Lentinula lateritia]KAJ4499939.1 hypothetical protein C8R41DRAFT_567957 [Lentinula lateritia]
MYLFVQFFALHPCFLGMLSIQFRRLDSSEPGMGRLSTPLSHFTGRLPPTKDSNLSKPSDLLLKKLGQRIPVLFLIDRVKSSHQPPFSKYLFLVLSGSLFFRTPPY